MSKPTLNHRFQFISREWLKILAMFFMLLDHAYMTVVTDYNYQWMTQVGRLAFPLFAFMIVEGYTHTKNQWKYIRTMAVFAIISEPAYNLMMSGDFFSPFNQNVMVNFLEALLFLKLIDKILSTKINVFFKWILILAVCGLSIIIGTITFVDYFGLGVVTVLMFYIAKLMPNALLKASIQVLGLYLINYEFSGGNMLILPNGMEFPEQGLAMFSLIFIWLYNGKKTLKGKNDKVFKYFSYLFYPCHILILSLISIYILK